MHFCVFDGTAVVQAGPGRPGQFSEPTIEYIRSQGHTVEVLNHFDRVAAARADLVWCEWANEAADEASKSGVCKRLIVRVKGYDIWRALDKNINWQAVESIVYESVLSKNLAEDLHPILRGVPNETIPGGLDLSKFPFKQRGHGRVLAMAGRADYRKGHQLMVEWAKQRPEYQIHTTMALGFGNPRLLRYLQHAAPSNFHIHETVPSIAQWVDDIGANYLLSASLWEDLGYTIAEGMALGLKPLVYNFPGARLLWPTDLVWEEFADLDSMIEPTSRYESDRYRAHAQAEYDGRTQGERFLRLMLTGSSRSTSPLPVIAPPPADVLPMSTEVAVERFRAAAAVSIDAAEAFAARYIGVKGAGELRGFLRVWLASLWAPRDTAKAKAFATAALVDGPRSDAFCTLGELAWQENDLDAARTWYAAACEVTYDSFSPVQYLVDERDRRYRNLCRISVNVDLTILRTFTEMVRNGDPFTFAKFGDGEWMCMAGESGANADGHNYSDALATGLREAFIAIARAKHAFIGDWVGTYTDVREALVEAENLTPRYVPYHLVLVQKDSLRPELYDFYEALKTSKYEKVFVGPARLAGVCKMLNIDTHVVVPEQNAFLELDRIKAELDRAANFNYTIWIFSAGMPAKLLIQHVLATHEEGEATCIDAGSAFDPLFLDQPSRSNQPMRAVAEAFFADLLR